ncbi:MAG TPA: adenylate/guanylate cyclase domain-containing protein, partial [Candidatus Limnocylindria bacterium]|nr:adenylate/guanylate cyclase domain-containing protein [Candidatus Limnocylindria bacterium]
GEVHRYVGDEVILTWTAEDGLRADGCVAAVFAIADALERAAKEYESDFGIAPGFWAGLHVGPVVTGEIGTIKHEIAYLGDTLNVAARIEEACKELEHQVLASADVVSAVELPGGTAGTSLGAIQLRGVAEPVELFAISRVSPQPAA